MKTLMEVLKTARENAGMTVRDVDKASGGFISHCYFSQLENGIVKDPSIKKLYGISKALKIDIKQLVDIMVAEIEGEAPTPQPQYQELRDTVGKSATDALREAAQQSQLDAEEATSEPITFRKAMETGNVYEAVLRLSERLNTLEVKCKMNGIV